MNESMRVLVADDEPHIRLMLKAVLNMMKAGEVIEAANGRQAIDQVKAHGPRLVLLDINMPVMTGDEALPEIKAAEPAPCVIMLTSMADAEIIERCIERGADGYILKDTSIAEIQKLIKATWNEFRQQRGEAAGG